MSLPNLFRDMPIRRKLMFTAILSAGVVLLFAAMVAIVQQWMVHRSELINTVTSQASIISINSTGAILSGDTRSATITLSAFQSLDYVEFAVIHDQSDKPFAIYVRGGGAPYPAHHAFEREGYAFTATHLDVYQPIVFNGVQLGTIHVRASLLPVYRQLAEGTLVMLLTALAGLGLVLALVARMSPVIVGPIENLLGLMRTVSAEKNYALRSALHNQDEVGALAAEFNNMLEQIRARDSILALHSEHLEQEVAQRIASLTEAQRIAHLGNWKWDIAEDQLTWSDEIYRIFGLAPQQFGANYAAFMHAVHPDDRLYVERQVRESLKQKIPYNIDHRILRPDGSIRYVRERGEVFCGPDGQPVSILGTVHDVTERWLIEAALLESEKRFRNLVEQGSDFIWEVNAQGIYTYVSPQCEAMLGYAVDEVIGKSPFEFMPPAESERVTPIFQQLVQARQPFAHLENINIHKDGHPVILETNGVPIVGLNGEFQGYRGVDRDITERNRADAALRKQQELTNRIIETIPHFVFWKDTESRYLGCNENFAHALGYSSSDEIIGKTDMDLPWSEGEAEHFLQLDSEVMTTGQAKLNYEETLIQADRHIVNVLKSKVPLRDAQGTVVGVLGIYSDITEIKQAEEITRKQQELTSQIIETIPMRVFWKDKDLHYLGCNTLFAKDAGLSRPDELIGKSDFDMSWKDQAALYSADDRLVMDANKPKLSYDEPQTRPDGGRIWLRTSKVPLHNQLDETVGMLGIYEDITQYKQMELRLLESEERFRLAFQYSAIGMALVGLDGHWLKVNSALCQILGYPEQALLGKTFQDVTHPDDLQSDLDLVARLLAGKIDHDQLEKRYFHQDGHIVWVRLSVSLIRDEQGHPAYFVAQMDDITADKLAVESLRKANVDLMLFRTLLDNSSDAIEVIDPVTLRYLDVNEKACRDLGYSREELLSMRIPDIDTAYGPENNKMIEEQMQQSGTARFETVHRRKDGSTFPVEVSMGSANLDKLYGLSVVRDITERKQVEERISKLNEELERKVQERTRQLQDAQEELVRKEKLAVLGQVAGSVGHELRNPLGVMSNAVYYLQAVLPDADETTKEYLGIIKNEIAVSDRIVGDLLDSVRTKPPQPQMIGVANLIEQVLHKCDVPASVTIQQDIPDSLPSLLVDPIQVGQVFRNLISNGIEAMPEGGTLAIRASADAAMHNIIVSVQDTGIGMTPEHLAKLFQPLFTTKPKGIGLGLVVVKNLAQANGGKVEVVSEIGKGTTFTVTLPAAVLQAGTA